MLANLSRPQQQPTAYYGSNTFRDGGGNLGAYDGLLLGKSGVCRVTPRLQALEIQTSRSTLGSRRLIGWSQHP